MTRIPAIEALRLNKPLIIGHRGILKSFSAIENTLPAFEEAFSLGADGVEFDVQFSKDGTAVVFHDRDLFRLMGIKQLVKDVPYMQLRTRKFRAFPDDSRLFMPTLDNLFRKFQSRGYFNLELKAAGWAKLPPAVRRVHEIISQCQLNAMVWISSFNPLALYWSKKVNPSVPTGLLFKSLSYPIRFLAAKKFVDALHPQVQLLSSLEALKRFGKPLIFWTVNREDEMRFLIQASVGGIITDRIADCVRLRQELKGIASGTGQTAAVDN